MRPQIVQVHFRQTQFAYGTTTEKTPANPMLQRAANLVHTLHLVAETMAFI